MRLTFSLPSWFPGYFNEHHLEVSQSDLPCEQSLSDDDDGRNDGWAGSTAATAAIQVPSHPQTPGSQTTWPTRKMWWHPADLCQRFGIPVLPGAKLYGNLDDDDGDFVSAWWGRKIQSGQRGGAIAEGTLVPTGTAEVMRTHPIKKKICIITINIFLPRDISVEILSPLCAGAFLVRCSESRPDSFALSVKVPNQSIVHYLIISNQQGWKIKVTPRARKKTFNRKFWFFSAQPSQFPRFWRDDPSCHWFFFIDFFPGLLEILPNPRFLDSPPLGHVWTSSLSSPAGRGTPQPWISGAPSWQSSAAAASAANSGGFQRSGLCGSRSGRLSWSDVHVEEGLRIQRGLGLRVGEWAALGSVSDLAVGNLFECFISLKFPRWKKIRP